MFLCTVTQLVWGCFRSVSGRDHKTSLSLWIIPRYTCANSANTANSPNTANSGPKEKSQENTCIALNQK